MINLFLNIIINCTTITIPSNDYIVVHQNSEICFTTNINIKKECILKAGSLLFYNNGTYKTKKDIVLQSGQILNSYLFKPQFDIIFNLNDYPCLIDGINIQGYQGKLSSDNIQIKIMKSEDLILSNKSDIDNVSKKFMLEVIKYKNQNHIVNFEILHPETVEILLDRNIKTKKNKNQIKLSIPTSRVPVCPIIYDSNYKLYCFTQFIVKNSIEVEYVSNQILLPGKYITTMNCHGFIDFPKVKNTLCKIKSDFGICILDFKLNKLQTTENSRWKCNNADEVEIHNDFIIKEYYDGDTDSVSLWIYTIVVLVTIVIIGYLLVKLINYLRYKSINTEEN
ncbi:hypothetical protein EBI_26430 [Enterocytozoon bieneusi H348]|nr:hypothetical protein EBI_26430 [Enterocytozoon bieneusi H348]|eukprot:XP_001827916.1 hypothetical protein EBI_26430 [Enterocytozoon bieneusi H348]